LKYDVLIFASYLYLKRKGKPRTLSILRVGRVDQTQVN